MKLYRNNHWFGLALVFLSLIVFMLLEIKNNHFTMVDYRVYYKAAERIVDGQDLYNTSDGFYEYKYSPGAALYFIPFTWIRQDISKYIFWIFNALIITLLHLLALKLVFRDWQQESPSRINKIVLLAALSMSVHYMMDIHLGQVNYIIYFLYALMFVLYMQQKEKVWPLPLALSLFLKPFGLIFIPYLLWKKQFRGIAYLVIYVVIVGLIPMIFYGPAEFLHQYNMWVYEMTKELSIKQDLLAQGNHTIFSVLARYTPIGFIDFTPTLVSIYQLTILALLGVFVLWFIQKRKDAQSEVANLGLLAGLIPLLAYTNTNSFGSLFLVVYLLLVHFKSTATFARILIVAGLVLTGGNIYDIWGPDLSRLLKMWSLITIGALLLIWALSVLRKRQIV